MDTQEDFQSAQNVPENNLIILSKQTLDVLLKEDNPGDIIALYTFYYYTAKWQKTNQAKVNNNYAKNGLHWGQDRLNNAKNTLIRLGLIENITHRDDQGKIIGWYIKLNYLWKNETIQNTQNQQVEEATPCKRKTNALSVSTRNALNANKEICTQIFEHWKKTMNHPKAVMDGKRLSKIASALRLYPPEDLMKAIDGCKKSDWHMGRDPKNPKVFDGIELILRNAEKIEMFIGMTQSAKKETTYRKASEMNYDIPQ